MIAVTRDGNGPTELNGNSSHASFTQVSRVGRCTLRQRSARCANCAAHSGEAIPQRVEAMCGERYFSSNRVYALVGDARYSLHRSCTLASLQALVARPALSIFVTSQRLIVGVRRRAALHTRARGARAATRAARARRAVPGRGRGRGQGRNQGQGQGPGPGQRLGSGPEARGQGPGPEARGNGQGQRLGTRG